MNKLRSIIIEIFRIIGKNIKQGYDSMIKPKQIMNLLFYLFLIQFLIQLHTGVDTPWDITLGLYFIVCIWKIIKQGRWKHRIRDSYKNL